MTQKTLDKLNRAIKALEIALASDSSDVVSESVKHGASKERFAQHQKLVDLVFAVKGFRNSAETEMYLTSKEERA